MNEEHPLLIDTRSLPRQPGASRRLTATVTPDSDIGNEVVAVADRPVEVDVLLESVLDGILATGSADIELTGECVRCLDPLTSPLPLSFRVFFTYPGAEAVAEDDDIVPLDGHMLDLRPAFRDAMVLALPLSPVCRVDCPGLCADCGARLDDDPGHAHERSDPRLAVLEQLREDLSRETGDEGD